jgi:SAM-dependent methyltransferase
MSRADRERWEARWRERAADPGPPEPWLVANARELPRGPVLDVAAGMGRNALWLAARGWQVTALDIAAPALERLEVAAVGRRVVVATRCADLDAPEALDGLGPFAGLLVVRYKPSGAQWRRLIGVLGPGGRLLLCSFGRERAAAGFDPAYCLEEGELRASLEPALACLRYERLGPDSDWLEGSIWERPA